MALGPMLEWKRRDFEKEEGEEKMSKEEVDSSIEHSFDDMSLSEVELSCYEGG